MVNDAQFCINGFFRRIGCPIRALPRSSICSSRFGSGVGVLVLPRMVRKRRRIRRSIWSTSHPMESSL